MAYLNEVSPATVADWLNNFSNAQNNIFEPFQSNSLLSKSIYDALNNNNQYNIRLYMGLDEAGNPKIIALSSYYLESGDYSENGYTDLIVEGKIYELYADEVISVDTAKLFIGNWKENFDNNLFKFGFLLPRPNVVKFFEEENLPNVRIFFGIDGEGEIKMMMQKPNGGSGDVVIDCVSPCPPCCSADNRMIV